MLEKYHGQSRGKPGGTYISLKRNACGRLRWACILVIEILLNQSVFSTDFQLYSQYIYFQEHLILNCFGATPSVLYNSLKRTMSLSGTNFFGSCIWNGFLRQWTKHNSQPFLIVQELSKIYRALCEPYVC